MTDMTLHWMTKHYRKYHPRLRPWPCSCAHYSIPNSIKAQYYTVELEMGWTSALMYCVICLEVHPPLQLCTEMTSLPFDVWLRHAKRYHHTLKCRQVTPSNGSRGIGHCLRWWLVPFSMVYVIGLLYHIRYYV